jgi:hypothetical protein
LSLGVAAILLAVLTNEAGAELRPGQVAEELVQPMATIRMAAQAPTRPHVIRLEPIGTSKPSEDGALQPAEIDPAILARSGVDRQPTNGGYGLPHNPNLQRLARWPGGFVPRRGLPG